MSTLRAIGEQLGNANLTEIQKTTANLPGGSASTVFCIVAESQAKRGNLPQAQAAAQQIRDASVKSQALAEIAGTQASKGDYAAARDTLRAAKETYPAQGPTAEDIELEIAQAQLGRGETADAHKTIASLKSSDMKASAMLFAADTLFAKGDATTAKTWLEEGLNMNSSGDSFLRYMAIPLEIKLGMKDRAMQSAPEMSVKGYAAVAVTCAELKDFGCMDSAVERMRSIKSKPGDMEMPEFQAKLSTLGVATALVDAGAFDQAARLLRSLESQQSGPAEQVIQTDVQLLTVVSLARQGKFAEARSKALRMHPNSIANVQRGTALRITAAIEAKEKGAASVQTWAAILADPEDRAYALLGIVQALQGTADVKLPYSAIQIH